MTERLHFHFYALEKEMATHSSVLAWRIPGMGEPGGLPSLGSHRIGHNWSDLAAYNTSNIKSLLFLSHWVTSDCAIPSTVHYQAPLSIGFPRQEYWSGVPLPSPKNTGVGCNFLLQCIKVKVKSLSHVRLLVTPWTAAHQAPPSMGFSRQEYWSGMPLPFPPLVHTLFQNNIKELILS